MRWSSSGRRACLGASAAASEGGFFGPAIPPLDFCDAVDFGAVADGVAADNAEGEGGRAGLAMAPIAFGAPGAVGAPEAFGAGIGGGAAGAEADGAARGGGIGAVATGSSAARAI